MKKIWILLLAALLLTFAMGMASAADVNPGQMGNQGGVNLPPVTNQIPPQRSAPDTPSAGSISDTSSAPATYFDPNTATTIDWNPGAVGDGEGAAGSDEDILYVDNDEQGHLLENDAQQGGGSAAVSGATQGLDWFAVGYDLINKNKSITVYDTKSGTTWNATYINGKNHADVIPASQSDAQKLINSKITGDYVRRPVIVTIGGTQYAGSMYAVGHGDTSYCSYFKGVMCIHFTGSQTHGSKKVDSDHQKAIQDALNYAAN